MPAWNAWIVGILLGIFAVATLSMFAEWEEWASLVLAAWLVVSPWVLQFATNQAATWTHVVIGLLVAAMSVWAVRTIGGTRMQRMTGPERS